MLTSLSDIPATGCSVRSRDCNTSGPWRNWVVQTLLRKGIYGRVEEIPACKWKSIAMAQFSAILMIGPFGAFSSSGADRFDAIRQRLLGSLLPRGSPMRVRRLISIRSPYCFYCCHRPGRPMMVVKGRMCLSVHFQAGYRLMWRAASPNCRIFLSSPPMSNLPPSFIRREYLTANETMLSESPGLMAALGPCTVMVRKGTTVTGGAN